MNNYCNSTMICSTGLTSDTSFLSVSEDCKPALVPDNVFDSEAFIRRGGLESEIIVGTLTALCGGGFCCPLWLAVAARPIILGEACRCL